MNWLKDLFKIRRKQEKLKVVETTYNNLLWEDRSYLVDLIFIYNNKTKRDVKKLMETNTNLNKQEIKLMVKVGSKQMKKIRQVKNDLIVKKISRRS